MSKKKKVSLLIMSFLLIVGMVYSFDSDTNAEDGDYTIPPSGEYFSVLDEDGNVKFIEHSSDDVTPIDITPDKFEVIKKIGNQEINLGEYDTYEEADKVYEATKRQRSVGDVVIKGNDRVRKVDYGIVRFKNNGNNTTSYIEKDTGREGYFYAGTAADGAYLDTSEDGQKVTAKLAGVVIEVAMSDVLSIEPYTEASWCSSYKVHSNGLLRHEALYFVGNSYKNLSYQNVGYKLDYLKTNVDYFSYDGHYFYSDYKTMINDYRAGHYKNAINANKPYYNYYQYLSHRTMTSFTSNNINSFLAASIKNQKSALSSQALAFINSQNKYTSNAGLMLGVSINESAWGTSYYALTRNNLFGHQAYDSNPDAAAGYANAEESINNHASSYVAGYLNAIDYRYRGPHLGDKRSGMNVKYASDAYWGEKAASQIYSLAEFSSNKSDYNKYIIGILNVGEQWFYKEANPDTRIYSSATTDGERYDQVYDFPVSILGKLIGSDGKLWYKILSDTPLTNGRNQIAPSGIYDVKRDYVYIPASSVGYLSKDVPDVSLDGFVLGDVNGNSKIDAADYLMIMDSILGKYSMNDQQRKAGDVNKNGKIDAADYLMIMDSILGKITIN